ncbi:MAG: SpoIVB peptidase S55, partial [Candidatus Angelobacter sp.]
MRRMLLAGILSLFLSSAVHVQAQVSPTKKFDTIPVSAIHAGMHGVAYTVFQGTKPEAMGVEVLGILKNANGPKGDIILVRLSGAKAEYTGVVAGMS